MSNTKYLSLGWIDNLIMGVLDKYVDSSNETFSNASHIFILPNHEQDTENFTYDGIGRMS